MRINEETLRRLIRSKLDSQINEKLGDRIRDRRKARSRDNFEKGDPKSDEVKPDEVKQLDDELADEDAPKAADNPTLYAQCQQDMLTVKTLVDDIQRTQQGLLSFGKKFRSAQEAKANRGVLLDFIKSGLEAAKQGDYPDAADLFCAAATRAENPFGGKDSAPVAIDGRIAKILDKWCAKFGGKRRSKKGTGRGGKGSPGTREIQTGLNNCTDPSPELKVDGIFGTNTTAAWKTWLTARSQYIKKNFPNVTDSMISAAQWGALCDAIADQRYPKTYGGMARFINDVCFGKGGGQKPPKPTPQTAWDPFKVTKKVRNQSAIKRKYLDKDGVSVGPKGTANKDGDVLVDADTFEFGFGGDNITDSDNVTLNFNKAFTTGIPLCFFIDRMEAEAGERKMPTKFETSDLDTTYDRGNEYIFNPIAFDLNNEAFEFDATEGALILTTSWVEVNGVRKQIVKYDSSSGDHYYAVEVDPSSLMVKFLKTNTETNESFKNKSDMILLEKLIRQQIKNI